MEVKAGAACVRCSLIPAILAALSKLTFVTFGDAGRFLATIKDEAAQKYTVTNVSFKVRRGYTFSLSSRLLADTAGPPRSSPRYAVSSLFLLVARSPSSRRSALFYGECPRWFRANHVNRRAYVISVARSKVRKEGKKVVNHEANLLVLGVILQAAPLSSEPRSDTDVLMKAR